TVRSATATQGSCRTAGATVTCDLGGVAAGSTVVSTLRVRADVAGSQALTAAVAAAEPDPVTANDAATETTAVSDPAPAAQADLAVALTHSPEPVPLDATAVLRVEVSNGGPDTATDVRVLDRLPPGLAYLSARVVPVSGADLGVEVRDTADPVGVGETLEYVVTVRNAGPGEASGVVVRDTLPAGLSYVSASAGQGSCTQSGAVVRCELGVLGSGAHTTVRIRVRAEAAGTHHNRVTVQGNEPDPVAANDAAGESTTVTGGGGGVPGDLALSVQDSVAPALRGQRFEQTVRVVNQGPDTVDRVSVYLRYFGSVVRVQPPAGCRGSRGTYRCTLGSVAGGDAVDLVFGVTPLRAGTLRLRAMVYGTPTDPDFSDNRLLHTTSVQ
ncbi:MAG TPA: DUF11 domain-containing protein, partial [Chromatiales bacterium]|nr:DUF11 domain-containing protein [Chromatiales bacterium]